MRFSIIDILQITGITILLFAAYYLGMILAVLGAILLVPASIIFMAVLIFSKFRD